MAETSFNDVIELIRRFRDSSATSLPQFTRPALIESPNFMQQSLAEEPIVDHVIKNLYNMYLGYVLLALHMNETVSGNRKVRDILGTVSTSSDLEAFVDSTSLIDGFTPAIERASGYAGNAKGVNDRNQQSIASGRQVEVKFDTGKDREPISVMLNVKFNTRLIPDEVVEYVISTNFKASMSQRWLQMRAGEIRFFKDFLFQADRLNDRADALRNDSNNALKDIFSHQSNANMRRMMKLAVDKNRSYNLANSIIMLDEFSAKKYASKHGLNFDKLADRNKFFAKTYALFVVLVDSRYSRVSIYTHGIDQEASYSFSEMKSNAGSDKLELREVMEYMSKNQMPRY